MRVFVTGATGLLGRKLVTLLARQQNIEIMASARKAIIFSEPHVQFEQVDVTQDSEVRTAITRFQPDVVIHAAAMTQVDACELNHDECWRQNVDAVANVVRACAEQRAHLVHVSTDFIFDGSEGPLDETAVPNPVNFYGQSKLAGERLVIESKIPAAIIRTVLVYGVTPDMSRSNIVLWVKSSLEQGKAIRVVNDQYRTPTLVEDLATGCSLAADQRATGIFHVSGDEMMTPYDLAIRTARFFHLDESLISATDASAFTQPAKRPAKTGFVIEKAKSQLGYRPHSFQEGLSLVRAQLAAL